MANMADWMPKKRQNFVKMAQVWAAAIGRNPQWGVPQAAADQLGMKVQALTALLAVQPPERTRIINARIKSAEKELAAVMRDIKKRYFYVPPLANADIVTLGLKPRDQQPTNIPAPTALVHATFKHEKNAMTLRVAPASDISADPRPYHGVKMKFAVRDQAEPPPINPQQLTEDDFITAKKKIYPFDADFRGKYLYYRLRWESKTGKKGPWGEIQRTLIA
jgi:hypothetical protein